LAVALHGARPWHPSIPVKKVLTPQVTADKVTADFLEWSRPDIRLGWRRTGATERTGAATGEALVW
jgi:hypothetical protein